MTKSNGAAPFTPMQGERPDLRALPTPDTEVSREIMMQQHMNQQLEESQVIIKTLERTLNKRSQELFEVEVEKTRLESQVESLKAQLEMQREIRSAPHGETEEPAPPPSDERASPVEDTPALQTEE